jgi:hypothetical protein
MGQGKARRERTSFQVYEGYDPRFAVPADVAIVYGVDSSLGDRLRSWREAGWRVHVMTAAAWGAYQDYLRGEFDGKQHWDEAQKRADGADILHGPDVPYMVPTRSFAEMLARRLAVAVDLGAEAIHLEEPEFWAQAGYSEAFKREWQDAFGRPWEPPRSSPAAQWNASRLKQQLYLRCMETVFSRLKSHARRKRRSVRCYVPTHSLLNYFHWGIVSPESALARLDDCDGFVGQVWTGTARTPNSLDGREAERTFETALLEYGYFENLARASRKELWLLADPVEDDPQRSWDDYRRSYVATLVASLLASDADRYEVMPWPPRVFLGSYRLSDEKEGRTGRIPADYAAVLLTAIHALSRMRWARDETIWGRRGVGIVVSDTMMFQRAEPRPSDPNGFYALALPLVKNGVLAEPVPMEFLDRKGFISAYKTLVLSYEFMKPPSERSQLALARWVKSGGNLIFVGDGSDPYGEVGDWWNRMGFARPEDHLWKALGLDGPAKEGRAKIGKGNLVFLRASPSGLARLPGGSDSILELVGLAAPDLLGLPAVLAVRRGPYLVAACLTEGKDSRSATFRGPFVDLLRPGLPIIAAKRLRPGEQALLLDLKRCEGKAGEILAASSGASVAAATRRRLIVQMTGPDGTPGQARLALPRRPRDVAGVDKWEWHPASSTLLALYRNRASGVSVRIDL